MDDDAEDSYCTYQMNGGDGPHGYANNSQYQRELIDFAKATINELIYQNLDTGSPSFDPSLPFRIADFGCSVGPNTFLAVQNIIDAVERKYRSPKQSPLPPRTPEFHVFFNDHSSNDFNTLFKTLPTPQHYFAAGVPGSFHRRLFPAATLHIAHSSTSLQWLSKVPKRVRDRNLGAWNKGRIHYTGPGNEVREAYSDQFERDVGDFLRARAEELVAGGLMAVVVIGLPDGVRVSESGMGMGFDILGSCLYEMAKMGRVSEEAVDSFNLPLYYTSPEQLKSVIERNGSFEIKQIEKLPTAMNYNNHQKPNLQICVSQLRAVIGGLIEEHFGNGIVDELFERHMKKLAENSYLFDEKYRKDANYLLFLKKTVIN